MCQGNQDGLKRAACFASDQGGVDNADRYHERHRLRTVATVRLDTELTDAALFMFDKS
jgi:hypothetical protein